MWMQDVLQKIKATETQAEQRVQAAKADVARRLEKAELESKAWLQSEVSLAQHKAELIIEQGTASAEAKAHEVALRSDAECTRMRQQASARLNAAVKLIRERVMTRDGRS
ncbi:MAG: hypothetical protein DDT38_00077 [Firmicutes bacterium]|nr:hypothetical protein [candidate division NPL-UPA2 bacterium]